MRLPACFRPVLRVALAALSLVCAPAFASPLPLIPAPQSATPGEGHFSLQPGMTIDARGEDARRTAEQFIDLLHDSGGPALTLAEDGNAEDAPIQFIVTPAAGGAEAYSLQVTPERIQISATQSAGLFYGAMSLWQLMPAGNAQSPVQIASVSITDRPRLAWRGLMLDSVRHFQSVEEVERLLDAMAIHKLNVFHWHLADDQGWRIQIDQYPLLTEVGGCRVPMGDGGIGENGQPIQECAFYTKDQIRAVVRYAAQRHITVVPEIDIPGHATAAIAAYPELGVDRPQLQVANGAGVFPNLFNADESTMTFLENVLGEVIPLFPGTFFDIGGDEAVKDSWKTSKHMQARIKQLGLKDEEALQGWMVNRLGTYLAQHGKRIIGWDEILAGGPLPDGAAVMSWRGIDGGIEAARKGHDVVMTPVTHLYFDYLQTDSPAEPPGRPLLIPLQKVYGFDPVPAVLDEAQRQHIIGVQANVFTEHMHNFDRVEHAVFPRIAALAEVAWSPQASRDLDSFKLRLPNLLAHYRALHIGYARTPFQVLFDTTPSADGHQATVGLRDPLDYADIRYTTDGSAPKADSQRYTAPLTVPIPTTLQAAVFFDDKPLAPATTLQLTSETLRTRSDEQLAMCTGALMLRLEDDGPREGPRAVYNVDIFNPCWEWKNAPLAGIASITVRAGRMPYFFELAHDEHLRTFKKAKSAFGELEIHDGCDGALIGSLPLPKDPGADGFQTLTIPLQNASSQANLCVFFTGDTRPNMWVLDRITLVPAAGN
ncbi:family 20 glycosylhydrolase [Pseudoxanthomonas sp.]|uniref:family 20 glycosylhydrolase n=1 Tax=Pseudoxanthomonas sp. TaxID=1871049 RepID=UPI00260B13A0|nr:family 20 glycosylhydrolase [Pseudoxanthomonas sp.]WDS35446.1 MAG: family 20 glycosylhydrolase [Pseudoxanthomonas sp.]